MQPVGHKLPEYGSTDKSVELEFWGMGEAVRPLKRNEEQKLANRQSILTAGMLTFKDKTYANTSVEDVIVRAGVSRATFYKHFSSKLSLAEGLLDEMVHQLDRAHERLARIENPRREDIVFWLESLAEIFDENKTLLIVLADLFAAEPNLREPSRRVYKQRIRTLARSFAAFREVSATGEEDAGAWDRALLLMTEIDTILGRETISDWEIDRTVAIEFLADQIFHFVSDRA
jgi:AcrR family transcriptional regulator